MGYRTFSSTYWGLQEDIGQTPVNRVGSGKIEIFDKSLARKRRRRAQALKRTDEASAPPQFATIEWQDPASGRWMEMATADASGGQLLLKTMLAVQRAVRGRRVRARSLVDGRLLDLIP
jgi:hypothetical protein